MKANRFPEHNEKLTILNTSPIEAEMSFCYLDDSKGDCFMLDPPMMNLKPGEQQVSQSVSLYKVVLCVVHRAPITISMLVFISDK